MIFTCPIKIILLSVKNDRYTEYGEGKKNNKIGIIYNAIINIMYILMSYDLI